MLVLSGVTLGTEFVVEPDVPFGYGAAPFGVVLEHSLVGGFDGVANPVFGVVDGCNQIDDEAGVGTGLKVQLVGGVRGSEHLGCDCKLGYWCEADVFGRQQHRYGHPR